MRFSHRFFALGLAGAGLLLATSSWAAPIESSSGGFWSLFDPANDDASVVSSSVSSSQSSASFWDQFASNTPLSAPLTPPAASPPDIPTRAGGNGRFGRSDFTTPAVDGGTAAIPEPGAALLFAAGFAAVALSNRRRPS